MDRLDLTLEALSDLIAINGLRIWSYQSLFEQCGYPVGEEWPRLLDYMIGQGQRWQDELEVAFVELAADLPVSGQTPGSVLRVWNETKSAFPPCRSEEINNFFGHVERAVLKAYDCALEHSNLLEPSNGLIAKQRQELLAFYEQSKPRSQESPFVSY